MRPLNDLLLKVAEGLPVERPPVWMMRQAGRFLPEYRAVRATAGSFQNMLQHPEFAAEVTLQPVDLLGVDAAIIFSDILVIPEAMGCPYVMEEKKGPVFPNPIRSLSDTSTLKPVSSGTNLDDTLEAIKIVKEKLQNSVPLIGFAGAPWTLLAYMIEGKGSKTFSIAKAALYQNPDFCHYVLQQITDATIWYLKSQIAAGVNIVQLFDSWAGQLSKDDFMKFSYPYLLKIAEAITEVPMIIFAKGAHYCLQELSQLPIQVIGLDWTISPNRLGNTPAVALQGNLDPCVLYAPLPRIENETLDMIRSFPPGKHIANLGHGIYPDISPEAAKCFINTVKNYRYS